MIPWQKTTREDVLRERARVQRVLDRWEARRRCREKSFAEGVRAIMKRERLTGWGAITS